MSRDVISGASMAWEHLCFAAFCSVGLCEKKQLGLPSGTGMDDGR